MSESIYMDNLTVPEIPKEGEAPKPYTQTAVLGKRMPRIDGRERLTGEAIYASDVRLPGMLYGVILRCPHAHAKVKSIDTSAAKKMPGVHEVIDAGTPEVKGKQLASFTNGEMKYDLFAAECPYEGFPVAAVAAETPYQACDAAKAIKVEYEVLPNVVDVEDALKPGAPVIHDKGNLVKTATYERGDLKKGFAEADVVLEETYRIEAIMHSVMERHGCVASWEGDELTMYDTSQGVWDDQKAIAACHGLPYSKVRVIGPYMGGGFGSKLQIGFEHMVTPILALRTGRPVKLFLSREDDYLDSGNRPPAIMKVKAGVKKDGTLTALEYTADSTGGPVDCGGIFWLEEISKDLYLCPNAKTVCNEYANNTGLSRPFRAPGYVQNAWAIEQMMDALAEAIKMDPIELRLKNFTPVKQDIEGTPAYSTAPLKELLIEGAKAFGWEAARKSTANQKGPIRRGVGMAACDWQLGNGWLPGTVILRLFPDGTVNINTGIVEIGTASTTAMAMTAAEELGIDPKMIQMTNGDTGPTQYSSFSAGSKTIPVETPATRDAAIKVKRQLFQMAAKDLEVAPADLTMKGGVISSTKDPSKSLKISEVSGLKGQQVIVGVGIRHDQPAPPCKPFVAQFCEVEVNTRTNEVKILRFLSSNDCGRVLNPLTCDNQTFGGITQGIGIALSEGRIMDRGQSGRMLNKNMHDYKLPTSLDVPMDWASIYPAPPDNVSNWVGAKGFGEPPHIPPAPAVANAVYNATGIRYPANVINPTKLKA